MLKMRTCLAALFILMVSILCSCASKEGSAEAYKGESPHHIFENGEADMRKGDFVEAVKRFEAMDVQYPTEPETELAELHLIYVYYRKEEYPMAEAAATRFVRLHPISQYTDYAFFMQGLSEFYENQGVLDRLVSIDLAKRDLEPMKKAFFDFSTVVDRFPHGRYAPAAYQYMVYLRNMLASHQLQVEQFYFDRKAYVAAINRGTGIVQHYQGAPAVYPALVLMAKAQGELNLVEDQKETLRLLKYNSLSPT